MQEQCVLLTTSCLCSPETDTHSEDQAVLEVVYFPTSASWMLEMIGEHYSTPLRADLLFVCLFLQPVLFWNHIDEQNNRKDHSAFLYPPLPPSGHVLLRLYPVSTYGTTLYQCGILNLRKQQWCITINWDSGHCLLEKSVRPRLLSLYKRAGSDASFSMNLNAWNHC